jgi:hypothetical protein
MMGAEGAALCLVILSFLDEYCLLGCEAVSLLEIYLRFEGTTAFICRAANTFLPSVGRIK